jgi:hypothetical protein
MCSCRKSIAAVAVASVDQIGRENRLAGEFLDPLGDVAGATGRLPPDRAVERF